jgi:hypothetical protein
MDTEDKNLIVPPKPGELSALAQSFAVMNPATADEVRRVLNSNVGPRGLSEKHLEKVKVPSGGSLAWSVPGIDGEEHHKELSGIIVAWREGRLYWRMPFAERGKVKTPPDCVSRDGFWGQGDPGGECGECPLNQFGSDPKGGRGKACKEVRHLLLLRSGHVLPEMITVPPTSIKNAEQYFLRLFNLTIPFWGLITNIRLERTSNADGIDYARMIFTSGPRLNDADRKAFAPYQRQMEQILRDVQVDVTDYESAPSAPAAGGTAANPPADEDAPF